MTTRITSFTRFCELLGDITADAEFRLRSTGRYLISGPKHRVEVVESATFGYELVIDGLLSTTPPRLYALSYTLFIAMEAATGYRNALDGFTNRDTHSILSSLS